MNSQARKLIIAGAVFGFLFVALGAFGAHGLKTLMSAEQQAWFRTGNLYLGIHAMAILFCGILHHLFLTRSIAMSGWLFLTGILIFSGTLFLMALGGPRWLGAITPVGGTLFLIGWGTLVYGIVKSRA
ncbi:MAG: DUF423 domain-containing protein [Gammaproteobacteria bacterium]|jgi:uncharacterized membrane protein YgdD (TMEM256/DUF423 family)